MPIIDLINNCVLTIGVKLANKIGVRPTILVALGLYGLSCILMICFPYYYVVLVAFGLFGAASGLGYFPPIKTCWKYYPKNNGLIFGVIVGGLGLSSSVYTPLADLVIVNPKQEPTDEKGYYPKPVANNLKKFLFVISGIYAVLGLLAFLLVFEFQEEDLEEEVKMIDEEKNKEEEKENAKEKEEKNPPEKKDDSSGVDLTKIFFSKRNMILLSFCICGLCK